MPLDLTGTIVLVITAALTFLAARLLARAWRRKKGQKEQAQQRANESRQVRRARERKGR
jgi:hypothetical protein